MQETPRFWQYRRMLPGEEKERSLNLLTTWEMSLQLLGIGEDAAELEKVLTLFAFFNPVNIGERLFSIGDLTTYDHFQRRWSVEPFEIRRRGGEDGGAVAASIFALP